MTSPTTSIIHNGAICSSADPILHCGDSLAVCGRGVFETIPSYHGKLFLPTSHLERLRRGASALDLPYPEDDLLLLTIPELLIANNLATAPLARVRITLTAAQDGSPFWWIEATPTPPHPDTARVITGPFIRNERSSLAGHKTTNCSDNHLAQQYAHGRGADEALFSNTRGEACEGAWSNLFVKLDGRWITPALDSGCLPGVTRALVIDLFRENALEISESTLLAVELNRVESAFLTSSLREIQPISILDERRLDIAPEITILRSRYKKRIASL